MLDLAISINTDPNGTTVIETNHGELLKASRWPQDCEFQLVAFSRLSKTCEIISSEHLASDIGHALRTLKAEGTLKGKLPDWYRRLALYAEGAE